jgi:hypothetical protein
VAETREGKGALWSGACWAAPEWVGRRQENLGTVGYSFPAPVSPDQPEVAKFVLFSFSHSSLLLSDLGQDCQAGGGTVSLGPLPVLQSPTQAHSSTGLLSIHPLPIPSAWAALDLDCSVHI